MFDQLFHCARTIERHTSAPLLDQRLRYLAHYAEQGAALDTLQQIANAMLVITEQMNLQPEGQICREEITAAADRWATREPRHFSMKHSRKSRSRFLSVATYWLRFLGRLCAPDPPHRPYAHLLTEFADYMQQEKGLAPLTIRTECFHIEKFLNSVYARGRQLQQISLTDIDQAIAQKGQEVKSRSTVRIYVSSLRAFFRYAALRGWCDPNLAEAILAPRVYRHQLLPVGPPWEDVQRLLASTEGAQPKEIRDRAILMLFAVYGLRSGEVLSLRIEDLDWEQEVIHVERSKQRRTQSFPLSRTVGEMILRYLREVRPRSPYREIFLTLKAPVQPLTRCALYRLVMTRLRPLGGSLKHHGPRSLRHACATRLLAEGFSMKEIGDHLGHWCPEATSIYAKVDINGLREVADFNLGGLQ